MFTNLDALSSFALWLEWFLFGKLSVLYALAFTLTKEVQLFPNIGVYSGIFALYLHYASKESRTRSANVVFYVLCILYVLCAALVASDLLVSVFGVSDNPNCKNVIFIISCAVSYQCTTASTKRWLKLNIKSHYNCSNRSKFLLWLHLPMHHRTHRPFKFYLSYILFIWIFKDLPLLDRVG